LCLLPGIERYISKIVLVLFLALMWFYSVRSKRVRQLKEELKISERLRVKKKGIAFTE
jgi:preprotein translocase subunit YajC